MNSIETVYIRLRSLLGPGKVTRESDILQGYATDETSDLAGSPDVLVRAETTADVSATLAACNEHRVPVIARGAGTGVTGGAVPVLGGVVLSLEKMNRILEIDRENMVALVEPGAVTGAIQQAVREQGLLYPPDPASLESCSIGGNIAENAGGPRAVKYGTTKDYVLGLELVLADGSVITTGGKFVKNATGYNLAGIILGSEGTLAVVTKIFLRLLPAPEHTLDLLLPFDSLKAAMETVFTILTNRIVPACLEFMEEDAIALVAGHLGSEMPFPAARAHLLVQLDGRTGSELNDTLEKLMTLLTIDPASVFVAESAFQRERLWKARRSIREAIHAASPVFLAEDCVVPRSRIPEFLVELKTLFQERGLRSIMFGHAGDGNVHIDVLKGEMAYDEWRALLPALKGEIYRRAIGCGGTITGEHGIGFTRKNYLDLALGGPEIALLRRIKQAFDPNSILNPGKIFPDK